MFDFILDYGPMEYEADFTYRGKDLILTFEPGEWAPGMWAGTEGLVLKYQDKIYKIVEVDLENRKLILNETTNL